MKATKKNGSATRAETTTRTASEPVDLGRALATAFLTNERVNQVLLDLLDPRIWRLAPPCSKRRNIATPFSHLHNIRRMYVRSAGFKGPLVKLERATVTTAEVRKALAASARAVAEVVENACRNGGR